MKLSIMKTFNLNQFKLVTGNRNLDERHVRELMRSISENGFNPRFYILVNQNMEIIDGQHRVEAVRRLNATSLKQIPIYYYKQYGMTLDDCIQSNELQKGWAPIDYVKAYSTKADCENREDYVLLYDLANHYKDVVSLNILRGICARTMSGDVNHAIRTGKFRMIRDYDEIIYICEYLKDIKDAVKSMRHFMAYCYAIIWAITHPEIDAEALKYQIKKYHDKCGKAQTIEEALRQLSFVYHYNDRRAIKLKPTRNFYSMYEDEQAVLREQRRNQLRDTRRAQRLAEKQKQEALMNSIIISNDEPEDDFGKGSKK